MAFASVYVPRFMVQAIVRAQPELRDRAVVIVEGHAPLRAVVAASEAAAQAGIELGMGESQAALFNDVHIRQRSPAHERAARVALLDAGWSISPRIEDTSEDTMVLDTTGLASLFQSQERLATALTERASGVGLRVHVAVASNIETAICAARGFAGITLIPPGDEPVRLSSLPLEVLLPPAEILATLRCWGIRTCGALAALPVLQLSERLGQEGVRLHQLAGGTHSRALALAEPEINFTEEMKLDYALTELEPLAFLLGRLLQQLCARLEVRSLAAAAFHLHFDLKDCVDEESQTDRRTLRSRFSAPTSHEETSHPESSQPQSYEKPLRLPVPMRDPKTLLRLIRLQLQNDPPHGSIVKIVLSAEPASPRGCQKGLFIPDSPDPEKLEITIARLAGLVGNSNVGSPQLVDTHRPGEFRMAAFLPAFESPERPRRKSRATRSQQKANGPAMQAQEPAARRVALAFRFFRPEYPAQVESREGCPCRIRFHGLSGNIVAIAGPWRTAGDWWEEQGWCQDEWDIEIRFAGLGHPSASPAGVQNGLYRIYYDWMRRSWHVRGRYD